jgi:hypothetical protein
MRIGPGIDPTIDGEGRTRKALLRKQRAHFGWQREIAQSHRPHHIMHNARIALAEPFRDPIHWCSPPAYGLSGYLEGDWLADRLLARTSPNEMPLI